jgi:hypothetical protein
MEGFGYKNWPKDDDDSYDTSTPPTYTSENYGFGAGQKKRGSSAPPEDYDMYNFDVTNDGPPPDRRASSRGGGGDAGVRRSTGSESNVRMSAPQGGQTRRMSTADRTKQILDSVKRDKPAKDDNEVFTSFQDSWNELMEDLESVPGSVSPASHPNPNPSTPGSDGGPSGLSTPGQTPTGARYPRQQPEKGSPFFASPGSDSFEISAADLEVGSIAARRSKEKAQERRRVRQSFDPDHMPPQMSPTLSPRLAGIKSPDIAGGKTSPRFRASSGVHESTALSSIDKADAVKLAGSDSKFYGGVDKSDGDLFRLLTEQNRMKKSVSTDDLEDVSPRMPLPISVRSHSDEGAGAGGGGGNARHTPVPQDSIAEGHEEDQEQEQDDTADYSDEFDEDTEVSNLAPKPSSKPNLQVKTDLAGPTKVSDSVEEGIVRTAMANAAAANEPAAAAAAATPSPALSSKDIERRKSMAEIQSRWFSPPASAAASPANAPTPTLATPESAAPTPETIAPAAAVDSPVAPSAAPLPAQPLLRPSPLLSGQKTPELAIVVPPESAAEKLATSVGGSFSALPSSTESTPGQGQGQGKDKDNASANGSGSGNGNVNTTFSSEKSGLSEPPSPPSSGAPSAAASSEGPPSALALPPPAVSSSVGNLFRKMSVDSDQGDANANANANANGNANAYASAQDLAKSRVSFDLNKNVQYTTQQPQPSTVSSTGGGGGGGGGTRQSAAMSTDSLDVSGPNLVEERAALQSRDNASAAASTGANAGANGGASGGASGGTSGTNTMPPPHLRHQNSDEVEFHSDYENFMAAGQSRSSGNMRYQPDSPSRDRGRDRDGDRDGDGDRDRDGDYSGYPGGSDFRDSNDNMQYYDNRSSMGSVSVRGPSQGQGQGQGQGRSWQGQGQGQGSGYGGSGGYAAHTASSMASLRSSGGGGGDSGGMGDREAAKAPSAVPLTLDVVVPSIDELHAQLAMIKAAEKRRREHRVDRSREQGSWERGRPAEVKPKHKSTRGAVSTGRVVARPRPRSSSPPPPPKVPAAAPEWDSLSRLEQSNSRLNRQFEDLSAEIKLLRTSTAPTATPPRAPSRGRSQDQAPHGGGGIAGERNWKLAIAGSNISATAAAAAAAAAATASGTSGTSATSGTTARGGGRDRSSERGARPMDSWDADALSAVKDILKESDDLRKKEKTLYEREKVLDIRENLINQAAQKRVKEKAPAAPAADKEKEEMAEEMVSLKSQLFQAQQHIFQLHAAAKAVVEGTPPAALEEGGGEQPAWDSTHYFELTCTYLTRLGRDPRVAHRGASNYAAYASGKGTASAADAPAPASASASAPDVVRDADEGVDGLGGKWVNGLYFIPHTVYLALQRDKLASESLLEASQKENARLMGVLKMQEKDVKVKEATFFDQQSELVKEINKLKNQLKSYSGVPGGNNESTNDELLTGYQYTGIGGMKGSNNTGEARASGGGRKAFEAEALIWRLQEQLAEAEGRAGGRENTLQQAIGRLTFDNERLSRAAGTSSKISSGTFVHKSEAHKTYFTGQLSGASAGWNDEDAPPPPPPQEQEQEGEHRGNSSSNVSSRAQVSPQDMAVSELQLALRDERARHGEEVDTLRTRLKWFADTQQAISEVTEERDRLSDLLRHQPPSPSKGGRRGGDSSFSSAGTYKRHPGDTKKIKYVLSLIYIYIKYISNIYQIYIKYICLLLYCCCTVVLIICL